MVMTEEGCSLRIMDSGTLPSTAGGHSTVWVQVKRGELKQEPSVSQRRVCMTYAAHSVLIHTHRFQVNLHQQRPLFNQVQIEHLMNCSCNEKGEGERTVRHTGPLLYGCMDIM